jgi:hypothetical protein
MEVESQAIGVSHKQCDGEQSSYNDAVSANGRTTGISARRLDSRADSTFKSSAAVAGSRMCGPNSTQIPHIPEQVVRQEAVLVNMVELGQRQRHNHDGENYGKDDLHHAESGKPSIGETEVQERLLKRE